MGKKLFKISNLKQAMRAIAWVTRHESHFRLHLLVALLVFVVFFKTGASAEWLALLTLTVFAVLALEIVNTAIEKLCDFIEPKQNPVIGLIKEISSASVLLASLASLVVAAFYFSKFMV